VRGKGQLHVFVVNKSRWRCWRTRYWWFIKHSRLRSQYFQCLFINFSPVEAFVERRILNRINCVAPAAIAGLSQHRTADRTLYCAPSIRNPKDSLATRFNDQVTPTAHRTSVHHKAVGIALSTDQSTPVQTNIAKYNNHEHTSHQCFHWKWNLCGISRGRFGRRRLNGWRTSRYRNGCHLGACHRD